MKKILILCLLFIYFCYLFVLPTKSYATVDPLSTPNNKIGIDILFPEELKQVPDLVNSNGGDWGYVTVVIQAGDKNLDKWQAFMDQAKKQHIIPIVRLATEGDYFNTKVWRRPTDSDVLDFANFLTSLDWPVKNRYVVFFNEVNRGDEWGGSTDPAGYAKLLSFATTVFKSQSQDFFIISSGLDNAAPNLDGLYMNEYNFMQQMNLSVPGIFNQIDGLGSHSYPNPGFSQNPSIDSPTSINSFQYEKSLALSLGGKNLPVFITETGWSRDSVSDDTASGFYTTALNTVFSDKSIVAITPFLLQGGGSQFGKFSLLDQSGKPTKQYLAIKNFPKVHGNPQIANSVLGAESARIKSNGLNTLPTYNFSNLPDPNHNYLFSKKLQIIFNLLMKI